MNVRTTLQRLGWNDHFQNAFNALDGDDLFPARVITEQRGEYRLIAEDGPLRAFPPVTMRRKTDSLEKPGVGDFVAVVPASSGLPSIAALLPRRSALTRQAAGEKAESQLVAANLDVVFVVTSMNQDFNLRRLERYLVIGKASGAQPVLVLNKSDLAADDRARFLSSVGEVAAGVDTIATSAMTAEGIESLRRYLGPGRTVGLIGSSGVGKSTIVNRLIGAEVQVTAAIRERDARGRHTTTHRELFLLPDDLGILLDTPGMRELQMWSREGLSEAFPDIEILFDTCHYRDCRHNGEPGCALDGAIEDGTLPAERWNSYRKLRTEIAEQEVRRKRIAERRRKFGRYGQKRRKKKR
ncbi:MAG: ribosome small subunit-dependent GTPase A [Myxococcota bacterium]|nr:ribosome small subunit-dependent GTPase A [Myxococcota bacterium]